jgi:hypothetical protein
VQRIKIPLNFTEKKEEKEDKDKKVEDQNADLLGTVYETKNDIRFMQLVSESYYEDEFIV